MGIDCSREINKKERIRFSGSLLKTRFLFGDFFLFSYFHLQLLKLHVKLQLSCFIATFVRLLSILYIIIIIIIIFIIIIIDLSAGKTAMNS